MTTYTSNENCFLIEGEVYFADKQSLVNVKGVPELSKVQKIMKWRIGSVDVWYLQSGNLAFRITHSTKDLDNVVLLPRDKFVKPIDVDALASDHLQQTLQVKVLSRFAERSCLNDFKAGHNANTKEFTREEAEFMIRKAYNLGWERNHNHEEEPTIKNIINMVRPLALPASVEINEQGEIVNIQWT
jgi:hypothetical protein